MLNSIRLHCLVGLFLLTTLAAHAQKESHYTVSALMNSKPDLKAGIAFYKSLYGFSKGEKIASVGAGRGSREVIYSMMADSLTMYIQDIDSVALDPGWISLLSARQYNLAEQPVTASFKLVTGTEEETRLPKSTLDKVILEHSLHEFTQQENMLLDIKSTLKPGGLLFVWELIAKKPGLQHRICKKQMLTEQELLELTNRTGFKLIKSVRVFSDVRKGKLYTFSISE